MPFNNIPDELISKIFKDLEEDFKEIRQSKEYLKNTLSLAQINKQCRRVALTLTHRDLWSTILLHWPKEIVNLYLERSRISDTPDIFVSFDTRQLGTRNRKLKHEYVAHFFEQEMKNIAHLELDIHSQQSSQVVADAICHTHAPRLQFFAVHLGQGIQNITTLFGSNAPLLRAARIHGSMQLRLPLFESLRELQYRVDGQNLKELIETLKGMQKLEKLALIGTRETVALAPEPTEITILPACTWFNIDDMESHLAEYALAHISFPQLESLRVSERLVQLPDMTFSMSLFSVLPTLATEGEPLSFELHHGRVVISMAGYRFESDWRNVAAADSTNFIATIGTALSAPVQLLNLQPHKIIIRNTISQRSRPPNEPLSLTRQDLSRVLDLMLPAYPSVEVLEMSVGITGVVGAIHHHPDHLPNLKTIRVVRRPDQGNVSDAEAQLFQRIAQGRGVQVEHEQL
ncbi:hypothetical protein SISSUDRAFT_1048463 [Sistotremastrum suecicum HHB10207 ss-3]|uniref:F-box domain-containing protein n=1 Tax=Sistotremastrum suecicum HHB10207 ss-3 TaxID=1314776 RepID=A0A166CIA4_9AGAM|nr:hypothetical protein SISSUDRAFT_1048463 [Sistotremastrum suecicum HHB10207 ss-3]